MKYVVMLGDGMADWPIKEMDNLTPLQKAVTSCMDSLSGKGELGLVKTVPDGMQPGSDVANLSVLGYDPGQYYSGRAPVEAASIGVDLAGSDVAFRCNLVTISEKGGSLFMDDYSGGHISTDNASVILRELKEKFNSKEITFYTGVHYRHLMVWHNGLETIKTTPPHDITGKQIDEYLPKGDGAGFLLELMENAAEVFNSDRRRSIKLGKKEKSANAIWLWGQGRALKIPAFIDKYGISGNVISAVDLIKGLGISAGLGSIDVPGATGYLDTNYEGKVKATLKALESSDFIYLHIEAPDEASHKGSLEEKLKAIEDFDKKVVKKVLDGLEDKFEEYSVMILPDHATPLEIKTHSSEPIPFLIYSSSDRDKNKNGAAGFNEKDAGKSGLLIENGWELMDRFIQKRESSAKS